MKKFLLFIAIACLYNLSVFSQKKYEMVVEKVDGTEVVINIEDILRTYFRERNQSQDPNEANLLGEYQECRPDGTLIDDATGTEVLHSKFYKDGTGDFWSVTKGKEDSFKYSFIYTYTFNGSKGSMTQTITSCTKPEYVGMSETVEFTYSNGIFHGGEDIYYKLIKGPGF